MRRVPVEFGSQKNVIFLTVFFVFRFNARFEFLGSVMFALIYSVENHDFLLSAQKMLFSGVFLEFFRVFTVSV